MPKYPLIFTFSRLVTGRRWLARVNVKGRALVFEEDALWWVTGVNPGAIAAEGKTLPQAFRQFEKHYLHFLLDTAKDHSFEAFRGEVSRDFTQTTQDIVQEWVDWAKKTNKEAIERATGLSPIGGRFTLGVQVIRTQMQPETNPPVEFEPGYSRTVVQAAAAPA